ncbi:hypothetical protein [Nocardia iowensis]|nr:hypothetical protein [Nocardia iowensis]
MRRRSTTAIDRMIALSALAGFDGACHYRRAATKLANGEAGR